MSRTKKGNKPTGTDFWSRRPGSNAGGAIGTGPIAKNITKRRERSLKKKEIRKAIKETLED